MRKLWLGVGIAGALLVLLLVALPYFFNAEAQRGVLASRLEAALGRKVKLGQIRLGLFPPALQVNDTEIAEALGFSGPAFSTAKQLRARVRLLPLLRGRLEVPSVLLEEPVVRLIKNPKGEWNFASLGKPAQPAGGAASAPSQSTPLEIGELRIRRGKLMVTDMQSRRPPVSFEDISLTVKNFSRSQPFEWEVSARPPARPNAKKEASFSAKGRGGPLNPDNLAETPGEGEVKFEDVDLAFLQSFTEQAGLGGLFSGDSKFSSDGKAARVEGTYRVEGLRLSDKGGAAQGPVSGRYQLQYDSSADRLNVQQFQFGAGNAVANTTGHLQFGAAKPAAKAGPAGNPPRSPAKPAPTTADLQTRVANAPLGDVARLLPALGVALPAGSSLGGGTLNGEVRMRGPVANPSRRGNVEVRNARLANYNVAGQLGGVIRLVGVDTGGKDTIIEQFKTSFVTENRYTSTPDLLLVIPGMNINGAGGFADSGALNLQGTATLTRAGGTAGALLQKVTGASNVIPFKVTGTLSQPSFQPDMGRIVAGRVEQQAGGSGAGRLLKGIGGLFGKK